MLLISRKEGGAIAIGEDVIVTVLGIKGGKAVLGVQAPRAVVVRREEGMRSRAKSGMHAGASPQLGDQNVGDGAACD